MAEAYIIDAVRTPSASGAAGSARSTLPTWAPTCFERHLRPGRRRPRRGGGRLLRLRRRPRPQAGDIARTTWLAAGPPEEIPGTTIDRQCGSSQQAVHFAAQAVMRPAPTTRS